MPIPRPNPGSVTTYEVHISVCGDCGHVINEMMCTDGCDQDFSDHSGHIVTAVYLRVDTFLRDEAEEGVSS